MLFIHDGNTELGRALLAELPENCECLDWTDAAQREGYAGPPLSAFPSVLADVPAYSEERPLFGAEGEFQGMARVTVPAHQELLRLPVSWGAVASFVSSVADRARLSPAL